MLRRAGKGGGDETLSASQQLQMACDATAAVAYLHAQEPDPIAHCDIKSGNYMVGADGCLKLADFGEACYVGAEGIHYAVPHCTCTVRRVATLFLSGFSSPM